eukprot:5932202-Amphidinium_carterae.1
MPMIPSGFAKPMPLNLALQNHLGSEAFEAYSSITVYTLMKSGGCGVPASSTLRCTRPQPSQQLHHSLIVDNYSV